MYKSYNSLREIIQKDIENQKSVLNKFPDHISRPITQSCSKHLAQFTSFQLPFKSDKQSTDSNSQNQSQYSSNANIPIKYDSSNQTVSNTSQSSNTAGNETNLEKQMNIIQLDTVEQVNWTLENIMYGLTLPLEYQDIIKDCWNVYHDWLSVLLDEQKQFVPQTIKDDPINYSRKMLWHLYALFIPRKESQSKPNELTKHIMMCHGVLMLIETIAKDSKLLKRDLWEDFLKFFLAINDAVLAPPFNKDDFGEILSSRIVATLFEIWLIACNKVFPSPSLWKTFQEYCSNWRHHMALVIEWNRVCFALTNRLLELIWWPESTTSYSNRSITTNDTNVAYDIQIIINSMNTETVLQAWFRFFHIIGKPIDFCDTYTISKTLEFTRAQRMQKEFESTVTNFTCIKKLSVIFLESIRGVGRIVDSYLGIYLTNVSERSANIYSSPTSQKSNAQTLEQKIRSSRASMIISSSSTIGSFSNISHEPKLNFYHINRPSVNSILHLVGNWLFEAAIRYSADNKQSPIDAPNDIYTKLSAPNREFILGQAEAYGILCKIFCSVKTNEKILPEYLSRFYTLILVGLKVPNNFGEMNSNNEYESGEILASIIVNGYNLFKLDLDGINILHLPMLNALNSIFKLKYVSKEDHRSETNKPKEMIKSIFNIGSSSVSLVDLKHYCISIFTSLLSLSNHLSSLPVYDKDLNIIPNQNFFSMRSKILEIFLAAMTNEQDLLNLQILFGCGRLIVGEWSIDEINRRNMEGLNNSGSSGLENNVQDKKERVSYCFNQVVSLISAPLKINITTLQNHSFALSIFDSLTSIAAGDILNDDENVFRIAISWIWHYVKNQIKRRSREHTKEMHSVIVAAYNCLIILLTKKPNLLRDKSCLQTVNDCIEIGISGSSSYPELKHRDDAREGANALMKSEKELKPASLRVKEAAECVLCFIMEYTSLTSSLSNSESSDLTRISLNEKSIIELTNQTSKFKYFAIDGSLIMAVCDKPLFKPANTLNSCPTLTILLRGPFTSQAWSLHLRNSPLSKKIEAKETKLNTNDNLHYYAFNNPGSTLINHHQEIHDNSENGIDLSTIPLCEQSIPSLSDVSSIWVKNLTKFQAIKEEQIKFEQAATERVSAENHKSLSQKREESNFTLKNEQDFQSARILLSHLGFCSLDSPSNKGNKDDLNEFTGIDSSDSNFFEQLTVLDNLPTRTFSSCSIFYVKKNQSNAKAIINNINSVENLDESFYNFLQSLGSIVEVSTTKHEQYVSDKSSLKDQKLNKDLLKKLDKINGIDSIFYWADVSSEIVFYLPNNIEVTEPLDEAFKAKNQSMPSDTKVLIVWLEQVQDADAVPVDELLHETYSYENYMNQKPKEVIILFVIPLKSKMHRILIWNNLSKKYFYTMPLVDGMLVSSRMIGSMVRQTILNIFRRKRLEIDDYQPPHVRRKNKISEIIKKFQSKKSEADFYTSLLMH